MLTWQKQVILIITVEFVQQKKLILIKTLIPRSAKHTDRSAERVADTQICMRFRAALDKMSSWFSGRYDFSWMPIRLGTYCRGRLTLQAASCNRDACATSLWVDTRLLLSVGDVKA